MDKHKAPGKSDRQGVTLLQLFEMFPDNATAEKWFEDQVWPETRCCGHCGSIGTRAVASRRPMPYWCTDCRSYFSVRTGTVLQSTRIPLRKWAIAIYIYCTSLKSVSSMKLHRDLGVTQKTAWFTLQRIREAWARESGECMPGPVEIDETYMGGSETNKHNSRKLKAGRGPVGKTAVVGVKDRDTNTIAAKVVESVSASEVVPFIEGNAAYGAIVYTDEASIYTGLASGFNAYRHESVKHSVGEYVKGQAHTNGIESFWAVLKRAHKGTFHKLSPKHLHRYIREFAAKHNMRELDTIQQMSGVVARMIGHRLMYRNLIRDNGLDSMARS